MKQLLAYWNDLGLSKKFSLVFNILLSLILLVAFSSYVSFLYINKAEDHIHESTQIEQLVLQMDLGQQKARQLIGSFFLHCQLSTFQEAHDRYAQPAIHEIARVISLSKELKKLLSSDRRTTIKGISENDLNLYLASAKRFSDTSIEAVKLVSNKRAPENGILVQLHKNSTQAAKELQVYPQLQLKYSDAIITYKEYLITKQYPVMQTALDLLGELHTAIQDNDSFTDTKKVFFTEQFNNMALLFRELIDIDQKIASKLKDFTFQETITEPVSSKLIHQSRKEAQLATRHIQLTQQVVSIIILTSAMLAVFAVISLARLMHASVTHQVLRLANAANEYSKGNLDVRVQIEGNDELGQLGTIFNSMAAQLSDLVQTLEDIVGKRTSDLEVSESFYRQLFDHGSNAIAIYKAVNRGEDFVFLDFNRTAEEIEDIRKTDVLGKKAGDIFPALKENGLLDVFREVWESGEPVFHPPFYYDDGRIEGWRQNRVYKLPSGEIVSMYDDLTQQKICEQEKEIIEKQLQQAQKMEAIGMLAGGVAHDLNNILTAIVNYPEIILLQLPEESPLRTPISQIHEAGLKASAVVGDLLTVARGVANRKEIADLNQLITKFFDSPEYHQIQTDHSHISYTTDLEGNLSNITCSTVHVSKSIMNLMINASEAIAETGTITVHSRSEDVDAGQAPKYGLEPGSYVVLGISDTGSGIAEEDLDHIFEPFYTKKAMSRTSGTGLGLSIVWNTMLDHDGKVLVHSSEQGTHFDLYFPATDAQIIQTDESPTLSELQGNGETILIVDDEPQLRDIAAKILQELGYETISKESGETAVAYLQDNSVDLVLLDMIMEPGMNGRDTFEKILHIHPGQKALLVSGFSKNTEVNKALTLGACCFIKKPYSIPELGKALLQIFNQKSDGATA